MNQQSKLAIAAIAVIIPTVSASIWFANQDLTARPIFAETERLQVFVSFYPLYETTDLIGKDRVDLHILTPPNTDPHDFEPSIKTIQDMQNADLIVINGAGFEQWFNDVEIDGDVILDSSNGITFLEIHDIHHDDEHEEGVIPDPHIWLNPKLVKIQAENIAERLSEIDPENSSYYDSNAAEYIKKLDDLDSKIRSELSSCSKKDFIVFHQAFSYFVDEYGLTQHTIIRGLHSHEQPTAQSIEYVINLAEDNDISVIFTEETANPGMINVIANEIGGKVLNLSSMEVKDPDGKDYVERMSENLANLKEVLCP